MSCNKNLNTTGLKRFLSLFAILAAVFCFSACSDDDAGDVIDDAADTVEDVGDELEDAGDEIEDGLDK